ncbi:MAG: hypothetical protein RIR70_1503 [Pseudomonadota bacterium]|jgi:phosphoglycolate phosphatase
MKKYPVRAVMFDLDGTLLDTLPDLAHAANAMLAEAALPALPYEAVKSFVGRGIPNLVKRCLTAQLNDAPPEAFHARMVDVFRRHYAAVNGRHTVVYPGVQDTLSRLQQEGLPLACVTNKSAEFSEPLLAAMGLKDYFQQVISGDTLPHKKPHPLPIIHACGQLGVAVSQALLVGDSGNDIAAARAAGCAVFCVPYGYNEGVPVRAQDCDVLLADMPDLFSHLDLPPSARAASAA